MQATKQSYHPYFLTAFFFNVLTQEEINTIPKSTRHDWKNKDLTSLKGHQISQTANEKITLAKTVLQNKTLLKINKALIRIIVLQNKLNTKKITNKQFKINIIKLQLILKTKFILKALNLSKDQYYYLLRQKKCPLSPIKKCLKQNPVQLLDSEVQTIIQYCENPNYQYWSFASIYHKIRQDSKLYIAKQTFYKYIKKLNIQRRKAKKRRKNNSKGIRAEKPLQILHADVTILRLLDNSRAYIHLIQDNFSRTILGVIISQKCLAINTLMNIEQVYYKYLKGKIQTDITLVTDGGSENKGEVLLAIANLHNPNIIQHIAQSIEFRFSNSMIEAANKQLKYTFLYHQEILDFKHAEEFINKAVVDYNNRPHDVLNGYSPLQVLNGQLPIKQDFSELTAIARQNRIQKNKEYSLSCIHY